MAEKIPGWLERVLLPQISELKGEIKATNAKIDGEFKVVHSGIKRLDQKIDGLGQSLGQKMDSLDKKIDDLDRRIDVTQRLTVVEGKVHELESRM